MADRDVRYSPGEAEDVVQTRPCRDDALDQSDLPHDVTAPAIREKYAFPSLTIQRIIVE